jgi:hypothetical protein
MTQFSDFPKSLVDSDYEKRSVAMRLHTHMSQVSLLSGKSVLVSVISEDTPVIAALQHAVAQRDSDKIDPISVSKQSFSIMQTEMERTNIFEAQVNQITIQGRIS